MLVKVGQGELFCSELINWVINVTKVTSKSIERYITNRGIFYSAGKQKINKNFDQRLKIYNTSKDR